MTLLNLTGLESALGLPGPLRNGEVRVTRWAGRAPAVRVAGDELVFPTEVRVPIVAGAPQTPLILEPTGTDWCYRIRVTDSRTGQHLVWYAVLADAPSIDVGDTWPGVDPLTVLPLPSPLAAAWEAALSQAQAAAQTAVDAAALAVEAAQSSSVYGR